MGRVARSLQASTFLGIAWRLSQRIWQVEWVYQSLILHEQIFEHVNKRAPRHSGRNLWSTFKNVLVGVLVLQEQISEHVNKRASRHSGRNLWSTFKNVLVGVLVLQEQISEHVNKRAPRLFRARLKTCSTFTQVADFGISRLRGCIKKIARKPSDQFARGR
jgi:hypothetical protein